MNQKSQDKLYMDFALRISQESGCPRVKVGAIVLTQSGMLSPAFNGHACGGPNEWEDTGVANPEVIHAEMNAFGKMLEQGVSASGSTLYCTHSPCPDCAKLIKVAKVARVVYLNKYRITDGIDYLEKYGVRVEQFNRT